MAPQVKTIPMRITTYAVNLTGSIKTSTSLEEPAQASCQLPPAAMWPGVAPTRSSECAGHCCETRYACVRCYETEDGKSAYCYTR